MPENRKLMEGVYLQPGEPLWRRVPTRGTGGELLNDFMMLIPGIREWPEERRQQALVSLQQVLGEQGGKVVFADLNLKLNLLWISMRPDADGCIGLAAAIKAQLPEAVLIASRAEALAGAANRQRRWRGRLFRFLFDRHTGARQLPG